MLGVKERQTTRANIKTDVENAEEKCHKEDFQTEETKAQRESFAPPTKIKSSGKLTIGNRHQEGFLITWQDIARTKGRSKINSKKK